MASKRGETGKSVFQYAAILCKRGLYLGSVKDNIDEFTTTRRGRIVQFDLNLYSDRFHKCRSVYVMDSRPEVNNNI